jgi:hypothetical protein
MPGLKRMMAVLVLTTLFLAAQTSDVASIERDGDVSTLSVNTFRPLDAVATILESQFGIAVGAEDPFFQYKADMMDISVEIPKLRAGTFIPARWKFEVRFQVNPDGSPRDIRDLLKSIVTSANTRSQFGYRLDENGDAFSFVATRTHDAQGRSIAVTPLLDRLVTIPSGVRRINESASLVAKELSKQTGLQVSCCQSVIAGVPWGMEEVAFAANAEPARLILMRLGLNHWHARCDATICVIDMR